jgi:glycosyltransferase involved in cell wall biosynthesis
MNKNSKRKWLILSYQANKASACSQHIDDKFPSLISKGIQPVLLSSPCGQRYQTFPHETALSIAPSGLRFELRSFLRLHCKTKLQFKLFETPLLIPILPFYLLEKVILNLESEWSWYIRAYQKGNRLIKRYQPEIIYSTGGPSCAHLAAYKLAKNNRIPWIAELQDPLIHDAEYHRSKGAFRYYSKLEKLIRANSCATIFMCDAARQNSDHRTGIPQNSYTIYPGVTAKESLKSVLKENQKCTFNHFGSLGGSRDGTVLIAAIKQCIEQNPELKGSIKLNFYGTCDTATATSITSFPFPDVVKFHGKISREEAIREMHSSSCLILIQNREFFSSETIPSKLYEYMHTGRPILALTYKNREIDQILHDSGHFSVPADGQQTISQEIKRIATMSINNEIKTPFEMSPWTADRAVEQLLSIAKTCLQKG